jgi:hypothetical protein
MICLITATEGSIGWYPQAASAKDSMTQRKACIPGRRDRRINSLSAR